MTQPIAWTDFRARLLQLYTPPLRAPSTLEAMTRVLSNFETMPGLNTTADLTTELVAAWIQRRSTEVRRNTVIGECGYLKAACSFALESGWIPRHPFAGRRLKLRREAPYRSGHHSIENVRRVLSRLSVMTNEWVSHRLFALAAVVAYTGIRRDEALWLQVADVRLPERILAVVARGSADPLKTEASAAPVPVPPELVPILEAWMPRTGCEWLFPNQARTCPWTGGNPGTKPLDRLKQAGFAVGVKGFTFQSLRHTWATHGETGWGLTEPAIQRVLRHTSPLTSQHYRHADLENLRGIGAKVSYGFTSPPASTPPAPNPSPVVETDAPPRS